MVTNVLKGMGSFDIIYVNLNCHNCFKGDGDNRQHSSYSTAQTSQTN